jgi:hypothetical protein
MLIHIGSSTQLTATAKASAVPQVQLEEEPTLPNEVCLEVRIQQSLKGGTRHGKSPSIVRGCLGRAQKVLRHTCLETLKQSDWCLSIPVEDRILSVDTYQGLLRVS